MSDEEISEYITFGRTFEKYKWYKPILVFILTMIFALILNGILAVIFSQIVGLDFFDSIVNGGYEAMNTEAGQIYSDLGIIVLIPSLYLAARIVKDRPFSSYVSSRGGWNYKLYFKALIIPFIIFMISGIIEAAMGGFQGTYHFSVVFLLICLILVPLQCIAEEYLYRGLIMQTLGSWSNIPVLAIIIQSVIFAVSHGYNSLGNFEIFFGGLMFGFLAWKSNGIEVSSALHTAMNMSIALLVMFGLQSSATNITLFDFAYALVFEVIVFLIVYYVAAKTDWFGEIGENSK